MTNYELMLIIDPQLSDDDTTANLEEVKGFITQVGGKVTSEDIWGDKKLAYKINKSDRGYYALYQIELDGTQIKEINTKMNLNTNIWRYAFVKIED